MQRLRGRDPLRLGLGFPKIARIPQATLWLYASIERGPASPNRTANGREAAYEPFGTASSPIPDHR